MNNVTPQDTRYVPFTQQHSCCVPTSISMVMYKLGIPLVPQELLGYHLGLVLDRKHRDLFWNARVGKRPKTGHGTQMSKKQFNINSAFKKLKIPIKVKEYLFSDFKTKGELISFISNQIKKDKSLIVLLASDALNGTSNKNGHACVIDRIYPTKDTIRLIDPSAVQAKWREIKINKFIRAVKLHPGGKGRILQLEKYR